MKKYLFFILFLLTFSSIAQDKSTLENSQSKTNIDIPGYLKLNIGFNFLSENDPSMDIKSFASRSINFNYSKPIFLSDNFSFNPGIGLSAENYSFTNDVILLEEVDIDGIINISIDTLDISPKTNKLMMTYLDVPVEFRYYFGSGKYDKGRFFIGVGGEVGLLIGASTKVKSVLNNSNIYEKVSKDFGLNQVRYGITLSIGIGNFNLFYKKYSSKLFNDNTLPKNTLLNPSQHKLGLAFSLF